MTSSSSSSSSSSKPDSNASSGSSLPSTPLKPHAAPANVLPGGTAHTANPDKPPSSKHDAQDYSLFDAAKTIKLSEYKTLHTKPCVRDALMTGITASAGVGGVKAVMGGPISRATNWAVFTFCASSFAAYQYCLTNRQLERDGMKRAVEVMERKRGGERRKALGKVSDGGRDGN